MTARNRVIIGIILTVLIGGGLYYNYSRSASASSQTKYRTIAAAKGDVTDAVEASGVVQPLTTVDVKSRAGGRLIKLAIDIGTIVKPGDLIARIDPSDTLLAYNQAVGDLQTTRAHLTQAQAQAQMQVTQSQVAISEAQAALYSSQVKVSQSRQQAVVQPLLAESAVQQAKADLATAQQNYAQLKNATNPQARAQARAAFDVAQANVAAADAAYSRQASLVTKGFVAAQSVETSLASRDVARANLAAAQQRLQTINADQQAALASAKSRVRQAEAALATAKANRVQVALRTQDVNAARSAVLQAKAGVENAVAGKIQNQIRQSDILAAKAAVANAEAAVANRKIQLNDATIFAPRAGVIMQKYVEEGTIITSGQSLSSDGTKIVQLGDISRLFVDVSVDESDVSKIKLGQKVLVKMDAVPDVNSEGRVVRVDPLAVNDNNVTNVHVRVEITHPDKHIKPGMNATCQFILRDVHDVLVVPSDAVKEGKQGGNTVRVLSKDQKVQVRTVEVGVVGSEKTEIKSGVAEGDQIVLGVIPSGDAAGPPGGGGGPPGGGGFGGGRPGGGGGRSGGGR